MKILAAGGKELQDFLLLQRDSVRCPRGNRAQLRCDRLPRALPPAVAREMILTGEPIGADRALALGMVNALAPSADTLIATAQALAARITANAPVAVRESLGVARQALDHPDADLRRLSEEAQARNMASEDFKEGPRAFIEKRAPRWQGR